MVSSGNRRAVSAAAARVGEHRHQRVGCLDQPVSARWLDRHAPRVSSSAINSLSFRVARQRSRCPMPTRPRGRHPSPPIGLVGGIGEASRPRLGFDHLVGLVEVEGHVAGLRYVPRCVDVDLDGVALRVAHIRRPGGAVVDDTLDADRGCLEAADQRAQRRQVGELERELADRGRAGQVARPEATTSWWCCVGSALRKMTSRPRTSPRSVSFSPRKVV